MHAVNLANTCEQHRYVTCHRHHQHIIGDVTTANSHHRRHKCLIEVAQVVGSWQQHNKQVTLLAMVHHTLGLLTHTHYITDHRICTLHIHTRL